ncbi:MAG: DUF2851 family protein [Bacteroidetes bacterium]|nr:DUF2851 family protein [Bacteroidota bacterium]
MHEDLLRHIWSRQLFDARRAVTSDGRTVRIIDPGMLSRQSGPDFRNARIEIGGTLYAGDVEFHRDIGDWELHTHQHDPAFNTVILHVTIRGDARSITTESGRSIPTLILEPLLTASVQIIADHLAREEYDSRHRKLACSDRNDGIGAELLNDWIRRLYRERVLEKVNRMQERLDGIITELQRTVGEPGIPYDAMTEPFPPLEGSRSRDEYRRRDAWEQLLYEEFMDCLGYSNNRAAMKQLAERLPLHRIAVMTGAGAAEPPSTLSAMHIEAALFKSSGLLPSVTDVTDTDTRVYLHALLSAWKELPRTFPLHPVHTAEWTFSPTRPANFPTIRIAAASVLVLGLLRHSLFRAVLTEIRGDYSSVRTKVGRLTAMLQCGEHPYWSYHYAFGETAGSRHAVLGTARIHDIIVNAVVPFVCLYATVFRDDHLASHCLNLASELPLLEDNGVLRTMRSQLVRAALPLSFAYQQQGLLQLHKRYCTAGRCPECAVGNAFGNR